MDSVCHYTQCAIIETQLLDAGIIVYTITLLPGFCLSDSRVQLFAKDDLSEKMGDPLAVPGLNAWNYGTNPYAVYTVKAFYLTGGGRPVHHF